MNTQQSLLALLFLFFSTLNSMMNNNEIVVQGAIVKITGKNGFKTYVAKTELDNLPIFFGHGGHEETIDLSHAYAPIEQFDTMFSILRGEMGEERLWSLSEEDLLDYNEARRLLWI